MARSTNEGAIGGRTIVILLGLTLLVPLLVFLLPATMLSAGSVSFSALQALLLFDTLIVVWRYTIAAEQQVQISLGLRREANKPLVVTTLRAGDFVVRNIGPGVAVNVFVIVPVAPDTPHPRTIGALGAGEELLPPIGAFRTGHSMMVDHLVVAEGLSSRTAQWTVSLNVVQDGRVRHRIADYRLAAHHTSLQDFLKSHWRSLNQQLQAYREEIVQQALMREIKEHV